MPYDFNPSLMPAKPLAFKGRHLLLRLHVKVIRKRTPLTQYETIGGLTSYDIITFKCNSSLKSELGAQTPGTGLKECPLPLGLEFGNLFLY